MANVTIYQVKQDFTRTHGFMHLEFLRKATKQPKAIDMSVYEVVFGEFRTDGYVFFPRSSSSDMEMLDFFFDVTNNPSEVSERDRRSLVNHFGYKGRSVSVSDIIQIDDTFYYCDSIGWEAIEVKNKPHWIYVGMGASGTYATDMTPFEVVRVTPSGKTVYIREMDWKVIEGGEHNGSAKYEYFPNEAREPVAVRKTKHGWQTASGMRISFGTARRYYDPHF